MPVPPSSAYQTAGEALALARAVIDDSYSKNGQILTGTPTILTPGAPMSYQYLNAAYLYLQDELINNGIETFIKELIVGPLTACPVNDPAVQVNLSDSGYFDGSINHNPPQLPVDLIAPLWVKERQTGTIQNFCPMEQANDGLPQVMNNVRFQYWEWRENDGIYFPGAIQSNDILIRYDARFQQLVLDTDPILIRGANNAMAYLTAWQYSITSGDSMVANDVKASAMEFIQQMVIRGTRRNQRGSHRRRGYGPARGGNRAGRWT